MTNNDLMTLAGRELVLRAPTLGEALALLRDAHSAGVPDAEIPNWGDVPYGLFCPAIREANERLRARVSAEMRQTIDADDRAALYRLCNNIRRPDSEQPRDSSESESLPGMALWTRVQMFLTRTEVDDRTNVIVEKGDTEEVIEAKHRRENERLEERHRRADESLEKKTKFADDLLATERKRIESHMRSMGADRCLASLVANARRGCYTSCSRRPKQCSIGSTTSGSWQTLTRSRSSWWMPT